MKVVNRKARYNYEFLEKTEAGMVLTGQEVKSIKEGRINLENAHVRIKDNEIFLVNAHVPVYRFASPKDYEPARQRKLLLHKKEILRLQKKMEGRNLTLVPISCYTLRGRIKLSLALARGKKKWQKKERIKRKDLQREVERELKEAVKF